MLNWRRISKPRQMRILRKRRRSSYTEDIIVNFLFHFELVAACWRRCAVCCSSTMSWRRARPSSRRVVARIWPICSNKLSKYKQSSPKRFISSHSYLLIAVNWSLSTHRTSRHRRRPLPASSSDCRSCACIWPSAIAALWQSSVSWTPYPTAPNWRSIRDASMSCTTRWVPSI